MNQITVYYDDTKRSCCGYAAKLEENDAFVCKKASEYKDMNIIYEVSNCVGFIFETEKGTIPYAVNHVIRHIVMNKKGSSFVAIVGGSYEVKVLRSTIGALEARGYSVQNAYSHFLVQQAHLKQEDIIEIIQKDCEEGFTHLSNARTQIAKMSKKELRKRMRNALKLYREYNKKRLRVLGRVNKDGNGN